jgi:hypothetical protein
MRSISIFLSRASISKASSGTERQSAIREEVGGLTDAEIFISRISHRRRVGCDLLFNLVQDLRTGNLKILYKYLKTAEESLFETFAHSCAPGAGMQSQPYR